MHYSHNGTHIGEANIYSLPCFLLGLQPVSAHGNELSALQMPAYILHPIALRLSIQPPFLLKYFRYALWNNLSLIWAGSQITLLVMAVLGWPPNSNYLFLKVWSKSVYTFLNDVANKENKLGKYSENTDPSHITKLLIFSPVFNTINNMNITGGTKKKTIDSH